ncbi:MAG: winged helix-turn-helix domain-containing protein [Pseudomonadales bacterium]
MRDGNVLRFGPFSLHPTQGVHRGGAEVRLTPKSLAVLSTLAQRAGEIVTKEELFRTVWPRRVVTEASLTTCIRELRSALHDDARNPMYIETVHRRGYRLKTATHGDSGPVPSQAVAPDSASPVPAGREATFEQLQEIVANTANEGSHAIFITGSGGIGKQAVAQALLDRLAHNGWQTVRVRSVAGIGPRIAYGPVLEALETLAEGPTGLEFLTALRRLAPTWLADLAPEVSAPVLSPAEDRALRQRVSGASTPQRQRELCAVLAAFANLAPLAICFENLESSDAATLGAIDATVRREHAAPLLLIGLCSLPQSDHTGNAAIEMIRNFGTSPGPTLVELGPLPGAADLPGGDLCHASPNRSAVDSPEVQTRTPHRIKDLLSALPPPQRQILQGASVVGARFSASEVSVATEVPTDVIHCALADLTQEATLIRPAPGRHASSGPGGLVYEFASEQILATVYRTCPIGERTPMHARVGRSLEEAYRSGAPEIAPVVAMHFEQAGELARALPYLYEAGSTARRRGATAVALLNFQRARTLLRSLEHHVEHDTWEADLSAAIGRELVLLHGLRNEEANACYARALEIQRRLSPSPQLDRILWNLWVFHLNRGPLRTAQEIADRLLTIAEQTFDTALLIEAHHALWATSLMLGDIRSVLAHTRDGLAVCSGRTDGAPLMTTGCTLQDVHGSDHNIAVCAGFFTAWADAVDDRKDAAVTSLNAAISHARDVDHPFTLAVTLVLAAGAMAATGDAAAARLRAEEGRDIAETHGFAALQAWAGVYEGWAISRLEGDASGLPLIDRSLALGEQIGMSLFRPFQLALAAETALSCGQPTRSEHWADEGLLLAERVQDGLATAELHRLKGELRLVSGDDVSARDEAAAQFESARAIAAAQGAALFARRAAASRARLG